MFPLINHTDTISSRNSRFISTFFHMLFINLNQGLIVKLVLLKDLDNIISWNLELSIICGDFLEG